MGRAPCCDKSKVKKGAWSPEEDFTLKNYLQTHGSAGNWITLPLKAGLKRCGKSCRLRWLNYLRPDIKHGPFTKEEDNIILNLYNKMGSRWSVIASHLEGRTDNDVKNYWNTKMRKKLLAAKAGMNPENNSSTILLYDNSYSGYMEIISNSEFSSCRNGPETKVQDYEIDTVSSFRDNANGAAWANVDNQLLFGSDFGSGSGSGSGSLSCPADEDLLDGFDFLEQIINSTDAMDSSLGNAR